ncbi:SDR family oxidoreductase [Pseudomaricurvus alkylphenolicus]|uniref:SDR family oxidoreductase n=1 Tax=Pseudomaricurvus alkylphenolicus TaxID=1306991 RepID=UPI00141E6CAF|nr:SDR family NAD(P)-dependent oxidoreductase [Pseudomaricurvus alkylphenolicus]NIB40679.1 SDR family oxidoreductase [Pseudomaricurvus alkylphenolicus]
MSLQNKTLVITGAAGGLGREVVRVAQEQGADVIQLDLTFPEELQAENTYSVDLTDTDAIKEVFAPLDAIDGLINVAGGFDMGPTLYELTQNGWDKMFSINVTTARNAIAAAVPKMLAQGRGAVVNVGAFGALSGNANMSAYCASKSVVMNMTQSLSEEVKHKGINVNAILPSVIDTPANRVAMPEANYEEWVTPTQLAHVMCFLVSEEANGIHGALIPVRGLS